MADAALRIPLAGAADRALARLADVTGSAAIAAIDGQTLLGERAMLNGLAIPGCVAAGGRCRLVAARDDRIALNLARPSDRALLPALFEDAGLDPDDDAAIDHRIARHDAAALVARGRMMGLAIAAMREPACARVAPWTTLSPGRRTGARRSAPPRVIDLSALWAGPLAAHLLWLAGSEVIKVEHVSRPDAMRHGQPDFYALIDQGKTHHRLDLHAPDDRHTLLGLIAEADIVVEAARPRALAQLGIDAGAIVRSTPGLVWLTITAHGGIGEAAGWIGFGDDVGVAAGLSAEMLAVAGRAGFVGDAIADPLTGIHAAWLARTAWQTGHGGRFGIAMRGVAASCLRGERDRDPPGWRRDLLAWCANAGAPFPPVARRSVDRRQGATAMIAGPC